MVDDLDRELGRWEPYGLALERVRDALSPIGKERIAVEDAQGRIAARDLVAPFQLPTAPIATRDGFALRASDTRGTRSALPKPITIIGSVYPDSVRPDHLSLRAGQAVAIATGATLPPGADAILPVERASVKGNQLMAITEVAKGAGVLLPGDDVRDGTPIVVTGRPLTPSQIGLLASTGLSHLEVFQVPHVGIISTGNEMIADPRDTSSLSSPDETPPTRANEKPPSNAIAMAAWCRRFGLPSKRWIAPDDGPGLRRALTEALSECHVLVTIGGTGLGNRDMVMSVVEEIGFDQQFEGVRLRPGRTSAFGFLRGRPTFVLPGTPTANETAFLLLALPGILTLAGSVEPPFPVVPARLSRDLRRSKEQRRWTQAIRVRLSPGTFFLQATPVSGRSAQQREGRLVANATADGVVLIDEEENSLRSGDIVGVILLHANWR